MFDFYTYKLSHSSALPNCLLSEKHFETTSQSSAISHPRERLTTGRFFLMLVLLTFLCKTTYAQTTETIPVGSRIINMGITPQTTANGLKPYGLIYSLLDAGIPIKWAIDPGKTFGGSDFTHNGITYRGGTFIIPAPITAQATTIINTWTAQGVVVSMPTASAFTAPIYITLKMAPVITLDSKNGGIAQGFMDAAGIPAKFYNYKDPQLLNGCDDVFAMPHADPTWATHSNLFNWNLVHKGAIWAGCHAVSALENMFNPANPSQQTNFLSNTTGTATGSGPYAASPGNSLVLWGSHGNGSLPPAYQKDYPNDPAMQFMGQTDAAQSNGSEQIYMPVLSGSWRSTTKVAVWDDSQEDVVPFGTKSPGKAAKIAYGQALGSSARGKVMYIGGHNVGGSSPDNIAAQRAYLNFILWASQDKAFQITTNVPNSVTGGTTATGLFASLVAPTPSGPYSYSWASSCGGTFSNPSGTFSSVGDSPTATLTNFTAPAAPTTSFPCMVSTRIKDACGRTVFESKTPTIQSAPLPPVAVADNRSTTPGTQITIEPLLNDSDPNLDPLTVTQLIGPTTTANGRFALQGNNVLYQPNPGFVGTDQITYQICDPGPLCATAIISVTVAENVGPCANGEYVKLGTGNAIAYSGVVNVSSPARALGASDASNYAELEKSTGVFILELERALSVGDTIMLRLRTKDLGSGANQFSIFRVEGAATALGAFTGSSVTISTPSKAFIDYRYIVTAANTRFLRIQNTSSYSKGQVDAVSYNVYGCIPKCLPTETTTKMTKYGAAILSNLGVGNSNNLLAAPNGTYAEFENGESLILDLGEVLPANSVVRLNMLLDGDVAITQILNVAASPTTSGFTNTSALQVQSREAFADYYYAIPAGGARYLQLATPAGNTKRIRVDAAVFISVICVSAIPDANNDAVTLCQAGSVTLWPKRNDTDPQGLPLTISIVTSPTKGLAKVNVDGSITYVGSNTANGTDQLTYKACNTSGFCDQATITFTVNANGCPSGSAVTSTTAASTTTLVATGDTWLDEDKPIENNGGNTKLIVDSEATKRNRALVRFTLPALPAGAIITGATLTLTKTGGKTSPVTPMAVHRVTASWTEGTLSGNTGEASWTNRMTGVPWTTPGGTFATSGSATANVSTNTTYNWNVTTIVKDWLDQGLVNNGFMVKAVTESGGDNAMEFSSSEALSGKPQLSITYTTITGCGLTCVPIANRPPLAVDDDVCTNYNQPITVNVSTNDRDPDGNLNPSSVSVLSGYDGFPKYGTATTNGTGSIIYTPNLNSTQVDRVYYQICDSGSPSLCDIAYVTICIQVPITAVNDSKTTLSGTPVIIPVYANDNNPLGGFVTVSPDPSFPPVNGGTIRVIGETIEYTPAPGFTGVDQFRYIVCNSNFPPLCSSALVSVTVVNQAPVPENDEQSTAACLPITIPVLANDSDPEGNDLAITAVSQPTPASSGTVTFTPTQIIFTPSATASGTVVFGYTVVDNGITPKSATALVSIPIGAAPVNNPPVAQPDTENGPQGSLIYVDVLSNDSDPDGHPLRVTQAGGAGLQSPANGSLSVLSNNLVVYRPNSSTFVGTDVFSYRVCDVVPVAPGCAPATPACTTALVTVTLTQIPVPQPTSDTVTTPANTPISISVTANDSFGTDGPSSATSISIISNPANGSATVNTNGTPTQADDRIVYTPNPNFSGLDVLQYRICDATGDCADAFVYISVTPSVTASAPICSSTGTTYSVQITRSCCTTLTITPNVGTLITVPTESLVSIPAGVNVVLSVSNTAGTSSFTVVAPVCVVANPDSKTTAFNTPTSLTILSNDIARGGNPASLTNVALPTITNASVNGTATINPDGTLSFTPTAGFTGSTTLAYQICDLADNTKCSTTTVTVTVQSAPPVARPDIKATPFNTPTSVTILANDSDKNGNPASLANVTLPVILTAFTNGTAVINPTTGVLSYTPASGFTGTDVGTYRICDLLDNTKCSQTTVTITVQPAPPVATNDVVNTRIDVPVPGNVLTNDTDPQGLSLTTSLLTPPTTGTVTLNPNGTFVYTPPTGFTGPVNFCYTATNTAGLSDTACVTVNVIPDPVQGNDPPVATNDNTQTNQGVPVTVVILANDSDPDSPTSLNGQLGTPTLLGQPANGTAVVNLNGTVTYTPPAGFTGTVSFPYQICDRGTPALCTTAVVTVDILPTPPNNTTLGPVAVDDALLTQVNTPKSGNVSLNDSDPNTPPLPLTFNSGQPQYGTVVMSPTGSYTYTPISDFVGPDSFTYLACNTANKCDKATVTIVVLPRESLLPPVPINDIISTRQNTPVPGNVLTNDTDPQNLPLTVVSNTQPANGTVVMNPNGSYTYTPPTGFTGVTNFCYVTSNGSLTAGACVRVDVLPSILSGGNNPPVAVNDNTETRMGVPVTVVILANDDDPDAGIPLIGELNTPTLLGQPGNGTAVLNGNGTVTYTPPTGFTGLVSFPYAVCDKGTPALCSSAIVSVLVNPAPPAGTTLPPVAVDDAMLTLINTPKVSNVPTNDYDPQGLLLTFTAGQPANGTVIMSPGGSYTYTPTSGYVGPDSFTYLACNTANKCDKATVIIVVLPPPLVSLLPKAYLQGALIGVFLPDRLMRDDLRQKGYLPTSSPYGLWNAITSTGSVSTAVYATTGANAIVDWIFVELRSATNPAQVVDSRSAFIQRDGDIVELDGVSPLTFRSATFGNYYVVVRHRNHLGVMTKTAIPLSGSATVVDFRSPSTPTYTYSGTTSYTQVTVNQAQVVVEQGVAMWAGNALRDNETQTLTSPPYNNVIYQGTQNDIESIYQQVINPPGFLVTPFTIRDGYMNGDINLDGQTIFQGTQNDVEFIYQNVIKNHPGNSLVVPFFIIREQLP